MFVLQLLLFNLVLSDPLNPCFHVQQDDLPSSGHYFIQTKNDYYNHNHVFLSISGAQVLNNFIIKAFNENGEMFGRYLGFDQNTAEEIQCKFESFALRSTNSINDNIEISWKAPVDYQGNVTFIVLVSNSEKEWFKVSTRLKLENIAQSALNKGIDGSISLQRKTAFVHQSHPVFDGCGVTKSCFAIPSNCIENGKYGLITKTSYAYEISFRSVHYCSFLESIK